MTLRRTATSITSALLLLLFAFSPALAASNALDLTFQSMGPPAASSLAGELHVPSLTAGSPVTGSGTMTLSLAGNTIYSGKFTATMLKSVTAIGGGSPGLPSIAPVMSSSTYAFANGLFFTTSTVTSSPSVPVSGITALVQLSGAGCAYSYVGTCQLGTLPATQDLILVCTHGGAVLDFSVTMGDNPVGALYLVPLPALNIVFTNVRGLAQGSIC